VSIGLGRAHVATEEWEEAAAIFNNLAILCSENSKCGSRCIIDSYELLFSAQAYLQKKDFEEALFEFSQVIADLEDFPKCNCWATDHEGHILYIVGSLYAAEILDARGNAEKAIGVMKRDLARLQEEFYDAYNLLDLSREWYMDGWILRWSESCLRFLLWRIEGTIGPSPRWEPFPYEVLWPEGN
jgi:tetratricopeptide (TPR) repeat protein